MKTKTNKQNTNSNKNENSKTNSGEILNRTKQSSTGTEPAAETETAAPAEPPAAPTESINSQPSTLNQADSPESLNSQPSTLNSSKAIRPYINYAEREYSRKLPASKILEVLRRYVPPAYELAEIVGDWIWIAFPEQPAERVRADLAQLGFHWNPARQCWQHPCGKFMTQGSTEDPRGKYGSSRPVRLGLASAAAA